MKLVGKYISTLLVLAIAAMLLFAITIPASAQPPEAEYIDDFSTDTGLWTYWGDAYRDGGCGYTVLTRNAGGESGILWNDPEIGVKWPEMNPVLSKKDQEAQTLAQWLEKPESDHFKY